jgi:proline racemase
VPEAAAVETRPAERAVVFPDVVRVIDSHTEGEPTRVVVDGWRMPAGATMAERRDELRLHWDLLRRGVVDEPRGHAAMVGALLTPPVSAGSAAGVIFFNNVGYLGMCGHGMMGVVRTLAHLGRLAPGNVSIDTPVGTVGAELERDGAVTIRNVPAYSHAHGVAVEVPGVGRVEGDVAWGGNWFFITHVPALPLELAQLPELMRVSRAIMTALPAAGVFGANGAAIDHVELTAPAGQSGIDACNFVLCPGGEYDRSPCGTGTSAKLAVLHAAGELAIGQRWRQASITGGVFTAWLAEHDGALIPFIRGRAWITGEATLRFDATDPFRGYTAKVSVLSVQPGARFRIVAAYQGVQAAI